MTLRFLAAATAVLAVLAAGTACGPSPEPEAAPATGLEDWVADTLPPSAEDGFSAAGTTGPGVGRPASTTLDVTPGWYAITLACAPQEPGPGSGSGTPSARLVLEGEHGVYGEGDCPASPVTTTLRIGASADAQQETVTVRVEADAEELFWGLSGSPTAAP
jgi:hypothetical protein